MRYYLRVGNLAVDAGSGGEAYDDCKLPERMAMRRIVDL
jgi:hypothetical protein